MPKNGNTADLPEVTISFSTGGVFSPQTILGACFLLLYAFSDLSVSLLIAITISLAFHELGHVCAYLYFGHTIEEFQFSVIGGAAVIATEAPKTPTSDAVISFAGPLAGAATAIPLFLVEVFQPGWFGPTGWQWAILINVLSLIPYQGTDGSYIHQSLTEVLSDKRHWGVSKQTASITSGTLLVSVVASLGLSLIWLIIISGA